MRIPPLRDARLKTTDWKGTLFMQINVGDEYEALVYTLIIWSQKPDGEYIQHILTQIRGRSETISQRIRIGDFLSNRAFH